MNNREKSEKDVDAFIHAVADKQGWAVNPEPKFTGKIAQGLLTNYNRHRFYLCPCRDGYGDREKERDIMCPCEYARKDIPEFGQCFCGLFLSREFAAKGEAPTSIPERRPPEKWD